MPSIGWSELLVLAVVAIVVVGPRELPRLMRVVGHWAGKARSAAREFQAAFDDLARESEMEEMRKKMDSLRSQAMFPDIDMEGDEEDEDGTAANDIEDTGDVGRPEKKKRSGGQSADVAEPAASAKPHTQAT